MQSMRDSSGMVRILAAINGQAVWRVAKQLPVKKNCEL